MRYDTCIHSTTKEEKKQLFLSCSDNVLDRHLFKRGKMFIFNSSGTGNSVQAIIAQFQCDACDKNEYIMAMTISYELLPAATITF